MNTAKYIQKLIDISKAEVGYLEKSNAAYEADPTVLDRPKDGAGTDNRTKYSRDLWAVKYFNSSKLTTAWCSVFVSWCFYQAFGKEKALKLQCQPASGNSGAGCEWVRRYYKQKGQWVTEPSVGDQIVFVNSQDVAQHTGIVIEVGEGSIKTVEGNSSHGVNIRSYSKTNSKIAGYGHPDWSILEGEEKEDGVITMKKGKIVLPYGSTGSTVNVRLVPGGKLVDRIKVGTEVDILEDKGEWCQISSASITGWVMSNYIEYEGQEDTGDPIFTIPNDVYLLISEHLNSIDKAVEGIRDIIGRG